MFNRPIVSVHSLNTVSDFMRYCRMPIFFQRSIRDMKVGDTFILGKYTQPVSHVSDSCCLPRRISEGGESCFVAEAWIEKERGLYSFHATWTFPTKSERPFIMTWGNFKICKGGVIEFDEKGDSVRSFALVCRYLAHMLDVMSYDDKKIYFENKSVPLFNGIWLDSDCNERKIRAIEENGKIKRIQMNYQNYMPTHQLCAIVETAVVLGQLPDLN